MSSFPPILADNSIKVNGISLKLYPQEAALLAYLRARPGRVLSHACLVKGALGRDYLPTDKPVLEHHISHIRRALGDSAFQSRYIRTHRPWKKWGDKPRGYEWIGGDV